MTIKDKTYTIRLVAVIITTIFVLLKNENPLRIYKKPI